MWRLVFPSQTRVQIQLQVEKWIEIKTISNIRKNKQTKS